MQGREQTSLLVRLTRDRRLTHLGVPGLARSVLTPPLGSVRAAWGGRSLGPARTLLWALRGVAQLLGTT